MLMSTVVLPESFSASHFADPTYHLNMEVLLRGIDTNGLILIDAEESLYHQMCDQIEPLATVGKGKTTHALFEELLKKRRQKIVRFVKTECSFNSNCKSSDMASSIATKCKADSLLTDTAHYAELKSATNGSVEVIPITEFIGSRTEAERRGCVESLPSLDQMASGDFNRLMVGATRFSRWLRFYDKQIGKGTGLSRFRKGMEKILRAWTDAAHFPIDQLSIDLYTVIDESQYKQFEPSVAYFRVKGDLIDPLQQQFGIPIKLSVKRDPDSKCHPRHLQTQSLSILFEKGFDILEDDGSLCRTFITAGGNFNTHLQEFRQLPEYLPPQPTGVAGRP